ncbi:MAG: hypothetical protein HY676_02315 [Chloroflexi bacterium]|nr:hypothetical protein [Chloroflexota bacterium]
MIKAVFFDWYNTLARFYPPREEQQVAACRQLGVETSPQALIFDLRFSPSPEKRRGGQGVR